MNSTGAARLTRNERRTAAWIKRTAARPVLPDQHRLTEIHWHTCITPKCLRRYNCENVCDSADEGLRNSICPECYKNIIQERP